MINFFKLGNKYAAQSDWKDFALTKFCLCAMGTLIGMCIPKSKKLPAFLCAGTVFGASYFVLMRKVFAIMKDMKN